MNNFESIGGIKAGSIDANNHTISAKIAEMYADDWELSRAIATEKTYILLPSPSSFEKNRDTLDEDALHLPTHAIFPITTSIKIVGEYF